MRVSIWLAIMVAAVLGFVSPSCAQATRTWVSGVGDDANPCSRTSPCKTFAGAISKTAAGGEIDCLDPGGFGAVTITKSMAIVCDNVSNGAVLVSGSNGIIVNLPNPANKVFLSGLDIEGTSLGATPGLSGVLVNGLGTVTIRNTMIRDFATAGVNVQGPAGTPPTRVVVLNSVISNSATAVNVAGANGAVNNAEVVGTVLDSNATGISVAGSGSALVLAASTITGQSTAISTSGGAQVVSYGNNVIRNAGAPTQTLPLQ